MLTVIGVAPSPFVRKVRVFLAEKGIPYEMQVQAPFGQPPEFLKISPLGKIPVLRDGDFTLPDSSAIDAYLERVQPEPPLYPRDPKSYGRALWFEEFADSKLAETIGAIFFNRVVRPKILKQPGDEEAVEAGRKALPALCDYLEGQLEEGATALVGGRFSIADIAVATQFAQLRHAGESVDAARWPKLAAYLAAIHGRPSFKGYLEEEAGFFK